MISETELESRGVVMNTDGGDESDSLLLQPVYIIDRKMKIIVILFCTSLLFLDYLNTSYQLQTFYLFF